MSAVAFCADVSADAEDIDAPIPAGFKLASGDTLADTHIELRWVGRRDGPVVLALGGISAGRDVCGQRGWWRATFVDHAGVDLDRYGVLGINFAPISNQRVRITPDDQARLIEIALDYLGIKCLHAFVGASYGAMVGLALAVRAPERVGRLCVISAADRPSAQGLAWRGVQRRIVELGAAHGDAEAGLALARQLAMITYRTGAEFEQRFDAELDRAGSSDIDRYLEARGLAYTECMGPSRWLSLSEAIDRFRVEPAAVKTPTTLVACPEDQLVPIDTIRALGDGLPRLRAFELLPSLYGHDAFLKEPQRLGPFLNRFLGEAAYG